jgi:hypothetical protein
MVWAKQSNCKGAFEKILQACHLVLRAQKSFRRFCLLGPGALIPESVDRGQDGV